MRASMTSRIHHVLRRVTISLALGAIVTVLVAWVALSFDGDGVPPKMMPITNWPISVPAHWPLEPDEVASFDRATATTFIYSQNHRGLVKRFAPSDPADQFYVGHDRIGWPFRALEIYSASTLGGAGTTVVELGSWRGGVPISIGFARSLGIQSSRIPIMPAWPGFLLNTLFYGTIVFAAMAGFAALKRRRRFKRGLCVQCAYPLTGGDLCPECGTAVASSAKPPAPAAEPVGPTPV